jgi:hypothetical protein
LAKAAEKYGWAVKPRPDRDGVVYQNGTIIITVAFNRMDHVLFTYARHSQSGANLRIRGGVGAIINYMKFYKAKGGA